MVPSIIKFIFIGSMCRTSELVQCYLKVPTVPFSVSLVRRTTVMENRSFAAKPQANKLERRTKSDDAVRHPVTRLPLPEPLYGHWYIT